MAISLCLSPAVALAATVLPYSETWGVSPNTVDVAIVDTGDWLQWTYTYSDSPTHTPKMTVAIDYPNGFCITTFDNGSYDGWYYAPDGGTVVRFADYAGGSYEDWVVTTAVGNVLTVKIKKSELGRSPAMWHGYANVDGLPVWIEIDESWLPTGEVACFVRSLNAFDVFVRFGYDNTRYDDDGALTGSIEAAGEYDGAQYMLEIPEGCVVAGVDGRINWLFLKDIDDGVLSFVGGDASFSEPCTLYIAEGGRLYQDYWTGEWGGEGKWVEVGTFTSIVDGEATLE